MFKKDMELPKPIAMEWMKILLMQMLLSNVL